jgi:hypothetical protein
MPTALQSADRKLLAVAALVTTLSMVLSVVFAPAGRAAFPPFSSYSPQKNGAKAAFILLAQSGYRIERWEQSFSDLPVSSPLDEAGNGDENVLLILAQPVVPPSKLAISEERDALEAFLNRGGRVLATGAEAGAFLPQAPQPTFHAAVIAAKESDKSATPPTPPATDRFVAITPSRITRDAPMIEMDEDPEELQAHAASRVEHYADGVVVSYAVGKGEVIWWADTSPLTNEGLPRARNLQLLLNCAGPPAITRILWDEHFHGERQNLTDYLSRTPAKWLLAQMLLVFAAALAAFGRRHGPLVSLHPSGSRLSPLEFVETLGDLYARKAAAPEALETAYQRFRFLLTRRLGLPPSATPARMAASAAERWSWREPAFLELLQECDRAERLHDVTEKRALWLVGELQECATRWRL